MSKHLLTRVAVGLLAVVALVLAGCSADGGQPSAELTSAPSESSLPEALEFTPPADGALPEQTYLLVAFDPGSPGAAALEGVGAESDAFDALPADLRSTISSAAESVGSCEVAGGDALDGRLRLVLDCAVDESDATRIAGLVAVIDGVHWAEPDLRATTF